MNGYQLALTPTRDALTPREVEVLEATMEGLTARQIGTRLHISPVTASTHRQNIRAKLRAVSMAHAVAIHLGAVE